MRLDGRRFSPVSEYTAVEGKRWGCVGNLFAVIGEEIAVFVKKFAVLGGKIAVLVKKFADYGESFPHMRKNFPKEESSVALTGNVFPNKGKHFLMCRKHSVRSAEVSPSKEYCLLRSGRVSPITGNIFVINENRLLLRESSDAAMPVPFGENFSNVP